MKYNYNDSRSAAFLTVLKHWCRNIKNCWNRKVWSTSIDWWWWGRNIGVIKKSFTGLKDVANEE
jgi:hypothetical protein